MRQDSLESVESTAFLRRRFLEASKWRFVALLNASKKAAWRLVTYSGPICPLNKWVVSRAAFDARNQRRRSMIGKVKIGQKALGLVEDDYRAMLFRITKKFSAKDCTEAELVSVLDDMKRAGFKPIVKQRVTRRTCRE